MFLHSLVAKQDMVTVKRKSFTYVLGTSLLSLLFERCRDLNDVITAQLFKILQLSESAYHMLHNCITSFAVISSCRDIMCESIPGSPTLFLFLVGVRREPGNEVEMSTY